MRKGLGYHNRRSSGSSSPPLPGPPWEVLNSTGVMYICSNQVLNSTGATYVVVPLVLDSNGTIYNPI